MSGAQVPPTNAGTGGKGSLEVVGGETSPPRSPDMGGVTLAPWSPLASVCSKQTVLTVELVVFNHNFPLI